MITPDNSIPYIDISEFEIGSTICLIETYTVYKERVGPIENDEIQKYVLRNYDQNTFRIQMINLKLGEFKFYLMIEAEGGEVFWTEALYFVSKCGSESAGI